MQRPAGRTILTGLAWSAGLVPWSTADGKIRPTLGQQYGGGCIGDHPGAGVPYRRERLSRSLVARAAIGL
jgi:hypothetical protein